MNVHQLLSALIFLEYVDAWMSTHLHTRAIMAPPLHAQQAGSFFNPVPDNNNDDKGDSTKNEDEETNGEINNSSKISPEANDNSPSNDLSEDDPFQASLAEMIRQRKQPSLASQPSTINGKPTAGQGFGTAKKQSSSSKSKKTNSPNSQSSSSSKPFVGIGPRSLNDPPNRNTTIKVTRYTPTKKRAKNPASLKHSWNIPAILPSKLSEPTRACLSKKWWPSWPNPVKYRSTGSLIPRGPWGNGCPSRSKRPCNRPKCCTNCMKMLVRGFSTLS